MSDFREMGETGAVDPLSGVIRNAYISRLNYPEVYPIYNRLWRADPEIGITRFVFGALASQVKLRFAADPDAPDDAQSRTVEADAIKFGNSVLSEIEGGINRWTRTVVERVPFYGWGFWELVPGRRRRGWVPPQGDKWRTRSDDGLIGVRRLGFRDHSTFSQWLYDDYSRIRGMEQITKAGKLIELPSDKAVHVVFGDTTSPEGLPGLEAIYRLERIKTNLEMVQGIGFERSAGHLLFSSEREVTPKIESMIRAAAKSMLTAQEGNFGLLPDGVTSEVIDAAFGSASSILEAIRYYGLLKLQVFVMHWVAISTTSGAGAMASMQDASAMMAMVFNSMMASFADQIDRQLGRWLFEVNADAFPGLTYRPRLTATKVEKEVSLTELGQFLASYAGLFDIGEEDLRAVRRKSGFMPDELPEEPLKKSQPVIPGANTEVEPEDDENEGDGEGAEDEGNDAEADGELSAAELILPDQDLLEQPGVQPTAAPGTVQERVDDMLKEDRDEVQRYADDWDALMRTINEGRADRVRGLDKDEFDAAVQADEDLAADDDTAA